MRKLTCWSLPVLIVCFALIMAGCEKSSQDPAENLVPDTRILSYSVNTAAEKDTLGVPTTNYKVIVYLAGSDIDGQIKRYQYALDGAAFDPKRYTENTQLELVLDFANTSDVYTLQVRAVDNLHRVDPTPAQVEIKRAFGGLETFIVDGVKNGGVTTGTTRIRIQGRSETGTVTHIKWALDQNLTWNEVAVNEFKEANVDIQADPGSHIAYFAAKRDDGKTDDTPLSISFEVQSGFAPDQVITFPGEGAAFFVPVGNVVDSVTVLFTSTLNFYYGNVDHWEYLIEPDTVWKVVPNVGGWQVESSFTLYDLAPGTYLTHVKTVDLDSASTESVVTFDVKELLFDNGILFVNGIDWVTYGGQAIDFWNNKNCIGNVTKYKFWDVFTNFSDYPAPIADVMGKGSIPSFIFNTQYFTTVVWEGNLYSNDDVFWAESYDALVAFLNMGGNLILHTRLASGFFAINDPDELTAYAGISEWSGSETINNTNKLVAVDPNMQDMGPGNGSSSASLTEVCKLDGSVPETQILFSFKNDWVGGFRVVPTDGRGQFVFIAGRQYRLDATASFNNYDYILRTYFGEQ